MKDWRDMFARKVEIAVKHGVTTGMRLRDRAEYESIIQANLMRGMFDAIQDAHFDFDDIPGCVERGNAEFDEYLAGRDTEKTHYVQDAFTRVMAAWPTRGDHYHYLRYGTAA